MGVATSYPIRMNAARPVIPLSQPHAGASAVLGCELERTG